MKLNPQQAPLYGECVLTVQLDDEDTFHPDEEEEEEGAEFYLLFSGSTQRHVSSTLRVSQVTLQAVCPAHNVCEQVLVTLCVARRGGPVGAHSQETFCFVQDLALDMAQFLLDSTDPQEALMLEEQQIPLKECEKLDQSVALALKHLSPPPYRTTPGGASTQTHTDVNTHTGAQTVKDKQADTDEARVQQLSTLLHLAARHGLRAVATFVLQQPWGQEALRRTNTRGETAAQEARRRGHEKLLDLFKLYETPSNIKEEPKAQAPSPPDGLIFQHHASLGTYTLTCPTLHQREEGLNSESRDPPQEVEDLRRLIHLHRDTKVTSAECGHRADGGLFYPAFGLQASTNGQPESGQDAGRATVTIETCGTTTDRQGSLLSLEGRTQGAEPATVTQTSCSGGSVCQTQEGEVRGSSAAGRSRKNKKRAGKSKKISSEEEKRDTKKNSGGNTKRDSTISPTKPSEPTLISDSGDSKYAGAAGTPLPIKPEGEFAESHAVAAQTTVIVEKQEAKKWEVEQEQTHTWAVSSEPRPAEETTETMGQEQSQDPQESQSDPEGLSSPNAMSPSPKSPNSERKPRRPLWRDGGWIGSRMGSALSNEEGEAKTVWYESEDIQQVSGTDQREKDIESQSVWYDAELPEQKEDEQLEQNKAGSPEQLLEQSPGPQQPRPHAAGSPPAPSHDPTAQRQEVHASQREEEAGPKCGRESETGRERKISETAEEEKDTKSKRKRRKKKGRRGGAEEKLSSSSSIESSGLGESQRGPGTDLNIEERGQTGRADAQAASETTTREEAEQDAMTLPGQTDGRSRDTHELDFEVSHSDPPEVSVTEVSVTEDRRTEPAGGAPLQTLQTWEENVGCGHESLNSRSSDAAEIRATDVEGNITVQQDGQEALDHTELGLVGHDSQDQQTKEKVEIKAENQDLTLQTSKEQNDPLFDVEFPGLKTQHVPPMDSNREGRPVDPEGQPVGFMDPERPAETGGLPCGVTADVSPLLTVGGRAAPAPGEYSEHCLASEMLRDQQQEEEEKKETCVGEEEVGKDRGGREESDIRMVRGAEESTLEQEAEQKYNEELAAAAVVVTAMAVASAVVSVERSQQFGNNHAQSDETARKAELALQTDSLKQPDDDVQPKQVMSSELTAAAEVIVTEAVASAMASIELSQQMANNQEQDNQTETEPKVDTDTSTSKQHALDENQTQEAPNCPPVLGSQLDKAEDIQGDNIRPLLEAKEGIITKCQTETQLHVDAASPSFEQKDRVENQPQEAPNHPFMLCPQPVEVDGKPQTRKEPLTDETDESTAEVDLHVETDAAILKELVIEETPTQGTQMDLFTSSSQPVEVDSVTQDNLKPSPEATNESTAMVKIQPPVGMDSSEQVLVENPTQGTQMDLFTSSSQPVEVDSIAQDSLKPSPEATNEPTAMVKIQPLVGVDSSEQVLVENPTQGTQRDLLRPCLQPVEVDSEPGYDSPAEAKAETTDVVEGLMEMQPLVDEIDSSLQLVKDGNQVQEPQNNLLTPSFKPVDNKQQDNPEPPAKVDIPDAPIPNQSIVEGRDLIMTCSQAVEVDGMLQPKQTPLPEDKDEIMGKVDDRRDVRVLFLDVSESGLNYEEDSPPPNPPCEATLGAAPPETGELSEQQSRPLSDITADVDLKGKDYVDAADFNQLDVNSDSMDMLDGWKERERARKDREKDPVEDTSLKEAGRLDWSRREDGTLTLQIQRDRDVFCPVQPLPEPSTLTCTDVLPETDECVSLCLTRTDKDGLMVSPGLDDNVFKKPADPPPRLGHRDRGVCVSWPPTEEACLGERPLSADPADPAAPRSSRLSWKSETEDRGGGEAGGGGGGEEQEKHDQLTENPVSSAIMRATIRSLSPLRRHSWEPPGNNATIAEDDATPSSPLKSQSEDTKKPKTPLHRRSMSWCPSNLHHPDPVQQHIDNRSYSLEGLEERVPLQTPHPSILSDQQERSMGRREERGSLLSLTEEEQEGDASSIHSQSPHPVLSVTNSCPPMFHHQTLTKSISMVAISHRDIGVSGPISSNTGSLESSISEEEPGPLRSDTEGKGGPKISRTFSYLRNKMTKKGKEKEKEKRGERERESKEKEKKSVNSHVFVGIVPTPSSVCQICCKPLNSKDTLTCSGCGVNVHKCCKEGVPVCTKSKTKLQTGGLEAAPGSAVNMRSKSTSSASSISSTSSSSSRWSAVTTPDDQLPVMFPRRPPSIFNTHSNLSKSISISNIAGLDEVPLKGLKFLSQSTDSLNKGSKVNASTESLTDEGTEMMDSQLMGEFECDVKDLEADSWSGTVDKKFLKTLKKDEIKRQDVIYELYQTEFHHVRTLRIMTEVYYKGLQKELQLDTHTLEKIFPVVEDLLDMHSLFFSQLLERKRASSSEGHSNNFVICSVGDVLCQQFSGCCADRMKKIYGKFCSRHNEAVNVYKDLYAKDKRFQAFIKRTMSSSIVRRLGIPECILLVTQRITKYPVLIQRILQHTKESDEDHGPVCEALRCVKELITAVDSKVNEQEKKQRLREVYSRTDSKSIMRMRSGQMFAKEDLLRRKLLHDGALQLKNSAGRLKEVQALLLSDVLVFLQEKDTKYVFASLDQRSTVISLQNLIVREVANEERGLFLITAGIARPEMVEVLASSKEERNTWRAIIQDAMHCMEKDEDEGVPSETEEDRRQQESRAKEIRELLRQKDEQIVSLLEEKVHIFRDLGHCSPAHDDRTPTVRERMLFRATADEVTKGEPIVKDALREVEALHALVHSGVAGAGCSTPVGLTGGSVGPVCLPRRAETFGGFDSHQMNSSKNGEKEEGDESLDLRRTESDSVLKKGATASLQILLKRNNEQVQHSVTHLHDLLLSLQAVVVQQDSFIEDQRQALSDRLAANSSRHSSSSSLSSSSSSRPSSLIEQEKHRSLERQRQEAASLQKQQAAHQEEKKRREKAWELKERSLAEREERLRAEEEETSRRRQELTEERDTLQKKKEEYQRELERLREAQRRLERDKEALRRDTERLEAMRRDESEQLQRYRRTPSTTSEDSIRFHSSGSLDMDSKDTEETKEVELSSSAPTKEPFLRIGSKRMGKNFNPFSSSSSKAQGAEKESQPSKLLQLTKPKEKKDKKKKKSKDTENKMSDPQNDGDIFFC